MKLLSVKILGGNFRSLAPNKLYQFNLPTSKHRLNAKIFAGLNGSGKSNFLELLSEIFYYLEIFHLKSVPETEKIAPNIGFEIEYLLPFSKKVEKGLFKTGVLDSGDEKYFETHVRIVKPLGELPEFSMKKRGEDGFDRVDLNTEKLLPSKVIAYTSGQNELISNPYFKLKYHYFRMFEKGEGASSEEPQHRLFYLDYNMNFSVFIANMLLANEIKVDYLKRLLKINGLESFRITINTNDLYKKAIPYSSILADGLEALKLCASTWVEKSVGKYDVLILDYKVNSHTIDAFRFHFQNSFKLFKLFYELEIFNLFLVSKKMRDAILQSPKHLNINDELPKPDPSRLVFRIENIRISKLIGSDPSNSRHIHYKLLSDGEHQFNEVVGTVLLIEEHGCLFLMDEPDTHFNPMWRAKFIKLLNLAAASKLEKKEKLLQDEKGNPALDSTGGQQTEIYYHLSEVFDQEIIITTHSPFVISDSFTNDVYKFQKNGKVIEYSNPEAIETYGASVGLILQEIFNRDISISELAKYDLDELRAAFANLKSEESIREKIAETKLLLMEFGESMEKFDLYNFIISLEANLNKA